ncbi:MAG: fibronectin type III domain-containing protein [Spirochaetes bacterium]|nr:fibronectin type III domain-containing protein [Spirochaetota bacterium]
MATKHKLQNIKTKKPVNLFPKLLPAVSLIGLILIIASCAIIDEDRASLILDISATYQVNTILPDIDMVPASYDFSGTGPGGSSFSLINEQAPVMVPSLKPGVWTVTVNAKNAAGTVIAMGVQSITLLPAQMQTLNITVTPVRGFGVVDLTVYWSPEDTLDPSIAAQLIPGSGSPINLIFVIEEEGTGTYFSTDIPTGYHTLVIQLLDNGILTMGAIEVVRVVKDSTATGIFEFFDINQPGGSIEVNITPEMNDPIEVSIGGQEEVVGLGESMTVEASVPAGTGNVVYVWYMNGESKATGSSYTTPADLPEGIYRLDVTVFTTDGMRAGSATHTFSVMELAEVTLEWDPNTETDLAGYNLYWGYSSGDYEFSADAGNQTSYTVTGLIPGVTYYFAVTAYNAAGLESDYSNEVIFTP